MSRSRAAGELEVARRAGDTELLEIQVETCWKFKVLYDIHISCMSFQIWVCPVREQIMFELFVVEYELFYFIVALHRSCGYLYDVCSVGFLQIQLT